MARRTATQDKPVDTEATTPEVTDTPTEAQAEVTPNEASQDSPAATGEAEAPAELNLDAFKAAVKESLGEGDPDIGTLPVVAKDRIATAYRALDGQKAKNAAKKLLDDGVVDSIRAKSLPHARSYTEMRDAVNEASSSKGQPAKPADPKAAYVNRLAGLVMATELVEASVPEGVDGDEAKAETSKLVDSLKEQVTSLKAWTESTAEDKGDAPEVSPVVKAAFKLAAGKAAGSTGGGRVGGSVGGPRKDVAKHVIEAFADKESGDFLKISEIANFDSTEYGTDHPSQGAVSARLFPTSGKCTIEGVIPEAGDKDKGQPRGARKA